VGEITKKLVTAKNKFKHWDLYTFDEEIKSIYLCSTFYQQF
jgi:hypothetical protein